MLSKAQRLRLMCVKHNANPGQDMGAEYRTEPKRPAQASRRVSSKSGFNPRRVSCRVS